MKKIFSHLLLPAFIVLFITGCKKESATTANQASTKENSINWKIENGHVVFSSFAAYRQILTSSNQKDKDAFINAVLSDKTYKPAAGSDKYRKDGNPQGRLLLTGDSTLDDDINDVITSTFLSTILNADGVVKIGNYLFNIDLVNERCYAMHDKYASDHNSYLDLLNGNTNNLNLFNFSTDDDVLDDLEDMGYPLNPGDISPVLGRRCREGGARDNKVAPNVYYEPVTKLPQIRLSIKLAYQKAGIWFGLVSKVEYQFKAIVGWAVNSSHFWESFEAIPGISYYKYKVKCGEEIRLDAGYIGQKGNNVFKEKPYEDIRGLSKYDMQYQFKVGGGVDAGYVIKTTGIYRITSGY